jgi:hypothetical protein
MIPGLLLSRCLSMNSTVSLFMLDLESGRYFALGGAGRRLLVPKDGANHEIL